MQDRTRLVGEQLNWKKVRTAICTKTGSTYTVFPEKKKGLFTDQLCLQKYILLSSQIYHESPTRLRFEICFDGDNE